MIFSWLAEISVFLFLIPVYIFFDSMKNYFLYNEGW